MVEVGSHLPESGQHYTTVGTTYIQGTQKLGIAGACTSLVPTDTSVSKLKALVLLLVIAVTDPD